MSNWKEFFDSDTAVEDEVEKQIREPAKYHVFLLNDDYTPMDFVVEVLRKFFNKNAEQATEIMLTVHYKGKGLCGTFTADIAETKVDHVVRFAFEHEHPLKCVVEKA
ncbi:ATP-dependent Clp protease adapter ClpS [Litorilituus lipolyticus]|uniref:ATP-dependent Clp protease adapter protein ClpS n=1 Tax=Litorilituus lipolyticus TaxID=2491017 RepID=A0A502KMS3_9GAMM|nr:ATP-dependent Clp protease adapter ClpS [Litorilituus lipolyticus]TPH12902.1 ATP-dependent Clp protease adapter ClpS [Litorilituus lipolyticus]